MPSIASRRRGVARIVRQRFVELGFDAVESADAVAERAGIGGEAGRSAQRRQDQVACGVVAHGHRRLADFRERHSVTTHTLLGDRRIDDDVACRKRDAPVEPLLALVDALEHGCRSDKLERAAHREALVGAVTGARARPGVEHGNPKPATTLGLQPPYVVRKARDRAVLAEGDPRSTADAGPGNQECGIGADFSSRRHDHPLLTKVAAPLYDVVCVGIIREIG